MHYATQLAIDSGMPEDEIVNSHPVVCTHPETGRRALFVNDNYTRHFDGWSIDDSQPLLDHLYAQFDTPEYTWRHRWQEGDLLIWDNRCAQHAVVGDTAGAGTLTAPHHDRRRYTHDDRHPLDREPRRPRRRAARRLDQAAARRSTATSARTS